ncbi:MAG: sigma-54-dependent transcriptional regulator [Gemmatimonadales bacterium]
MADADGAAAVAAARSRAASTTATVLIIDDHAGMREGLELLLRSRGHHTLSAKNGAEGLEILGSHDVDLVVADLKMSPMDGMELLRRVRQQAGGSADFLMMTAFGSIDTAVAAMKAGAADFVEKPFQSEAFAARVERLLRDRAEREQLQAENRYLRQEINGEYGAIVGGSRAMQAIYDWIARVAPADSTVMIYGESGTGKELVARAIHAASPRARGPFIRVNCGALAEGLLDSELFGHERGAFTGAERRRRGRFELAQDGTLFLDEIGCIRAPTQVRLLRVLQERELERVGGEETVAVNVRIVAATNTSAEALKASPDFREDLYYRLHVVPVTLPSLRERREDVPLLARHFVEKLRTRTRSRATAISDAALAALQAYDWPGNVRELENVVERALVLASGAVIGEADLPPLPAGAADGGAATSASGALQGALDALERDMLQRSLAQARGVKAEAARLLGIAPATLHYKLQKHGMQTP